MSLLPFPHGRDGQPFVLCCIGRRGSGKSKLCLDLLRYFYNDSFDFIIWISPTFMLQASGQEFSNEMAQRLIVFSEWRPEIITALFSYMSSRNLNKKKEDKEHCLLVLDDVGLMGKKGKLSDQLDDIAFISRNYQISMIEIAQRITLVTTSVRSQLDALLLFREQNPQERANLFRSFGFCDRKTFFDTIDYNTEEKYSWIGIRNLAGTLLFFDLNGEIHDSTRGHRGRVRDIRTSDRSTRGSTRSGNPWDHSSEGVRDWQGYQNDLRRLHRPTNRN